MLFWAVFTLGYLMGVLITIKFFVKENDGGVTALTQPGFRVANSHLTTTKVSILLRSGCRQPKEIYSLLTRVNYQKASELNNNNYQAA